jgi:hypothetical protein
MKPLAPHVVRAHDDAVARGDDGYIDPDTGLFVMTATYLAEREFCCGSGCRHCPYGIDDVAEPTLIAAED